jgi:hypothetical protein
MATLEAAVELANSGESLFREIWVAAILQRPGSSERFFISSFSSPKFNR